MTRGSPGAGLIMGTVVDAAGKLPVGGVIVSLRGGSGSWSVLTDGLGRFAFTDLTTGTYAITASKRGYADGAYARRRPGGTPQVLSLADGERLVDLQVIVWKNGSITGTVTDEIGEPLVNVPVRILARTIVAGKRKLSLGPTVKTDDRGVYRSGSLLPGDYAVAVPSTQTTAPESVIDLYRQARNSSVASRLWGDLIGSGATAGLDVILETGGLRLSGFAFQSAMGSTSGTVPTLLSDGRIFVYPTVYYPGVGAAQLAGIITVQSGEEHSGVDVQVKPVPTFRVAGSVRGPDGPFAIGLALIPSDSHLSSDTDLETARSISDTSGRFTFLGVPAGDYVVRTLRPPVGTGRGLVQDASTSSTLWAAQPVAVDTADVMDLTVTVRTGFTFAGRLDFETGASQPAPEALQRTAINVEAVDGRGLATTVARGQLDGARQFRTAQLPPGRYYLRISNAPSGWTVKGVLLDGRDVSTIPFALDRNVNGVIVRFTEHPSELSGRVRDGSGLGDSTATVLVFPADSSMWIDYGQNPPGIRAVRADRQGAFRTIGLPAGSYVAAAVKDENTADWRDPAVLQVLARSGLALKLADGEKRSVELTTLAIQR